MASPVDSATQPSLELEDISTRTMLSAQSLLTSPSITADQSVKMKMLFWSLFALLVQFLPVSAEQSSVCQQGIYALLQGLSKNPEALQFCSKRFPLSTTTITVQPGPSRRYEARTVSTTIAQSANGKASSSTTSKSVISTTNKAVATSQKA